MSITMLNQLLDPYPRSLEIKGGFTSAAWTKVIIISNDPPTTWYRAGWGTVTQGQQDALLRRLLVFNVTSRNEVWRTAGLNEDGTPCAPAMTIFPTVGSSLLSPQNLIPSRLSSPVPTGSPMSGYLLHRSNALDPF